MRSCGLNISAKEVRIVTLSGNRADHKRVAEQMHKITVGDTTVAGELRALITALSAHVQDHGIERIGLIGYPARGNFSVSSSVSRIEGALLATSSADVRFFHKATLAATSRKAGEFKTERPSTQALALAYDLAYECLG